MHKSSSSLARKKSAVGLLALTLVIAGVGASADNLLNSPAGGYLVCINSATKTLTHPGTDTCPKEGKKLVLGAQGKTGADGLIGSTGQQGSHGKSNGSNYVRAGAGFLSLISL